MIVVENLSKRYGKKVAVDGLDFIVQPGIVTGFLGSNGAGKSTTMRMIAALDAPTTGRVRVNGRDYRAAAAPMAQLGIVLEAKAVHPGRSARNHLLALGQANGVGRRRVDEVIEMAGLTAVAGRKPAGSRWGWASGWASPRRSWVIPASSSWMSRSTGWIPTGCCGSGTCSRAWPPRAARSLCRRT